MTNFEKIKNMSVEELAAKCCYDSDCEICPIWEFCGYTINHLNYATTSECLKAWERWLKSEVEE